MRVIPHAVAATLILATAVDAQGPVCPPVLEFSFSNPGARSIGFAGAFVALADDATAAYTNPSGLTQLLDPEVSLEARFREYRTEFTESGRVSGPPTGIGIDTNPGLTFSESRDRTAEVERLGGFRELLDRLIVRRPCKFFGIVEDRHLEPWRLPAGDDVSSTYEILFCDVG